MTNHFEAKLHGFRRTQDGVVISYVIHPNDVRAELATAALGTRYMIGFAELGDDDQPKELVHEAAGAPAVPTPREGTKAPDSAPTKDRRKFTDLPLSQQAAMRCREPDFRRFLARHHEQIAVFDLDMATDEVRHLCGVTSRAELDTTMKAANAWRNIEDDFQRWLTTNRFAESRR